MPTENDEVPAMTTATMTPTVSVQPACGLPSCPAASLRVGTAAGKGRAVYACRRFAPGELIERAPVLRLSSEEWTAVANTILSQYCFRFGPGQLDAALALGYGSLYNHSYQPNAYYLKRPEDDVIDFIAHRPIEAGDEVTVNYDGTPEGQGAVWFDVVP
jgi:hypothetical protein